ncbi:S1 RNA-binding domain-containing protein [Hyphomonas adhaerens MHS-3]|uniref:Small ribosomal subunit protein bS1 n=1 Tax=Hyphomonas adhaerens MHS-3 TaxID=1280949 RepID=A0A069E0X8_9PROT|nr:Tex family protein [Hyphomonas adhaerens]KCZ83341.1 S1 RNA-binding domain-containing protein [Hyphomonas adhaerens MHS-3]
MPAKSRTSAAPSIAKLIATELGITERQVETVIELLGEGATVPFIARYRKERTGGLDDTQLRNLAERLDYLTELAKRRDTILDAIRQQDKLTPDLEREIMAATTKVALEDLYAPYKQKRRTKATIAKEAGLEPLAERILANPAVALEAEAKGFVSKKKGVETPDAALNGAREIIVEKIAETPRLTRKIRETVWKQGKLGSSLVKGKEAEGAKFSDYFDFDEPFEKMPSHRALAMLRGQKEGILRIKVDVPHTDTRHHPAVREICSEFGFAKKGRTADEWLMDTAEAAWKSKLEPSSSRESINRLKDSADSEAIRVFSRNMKDLLMAAPAGHKVVMGIDPGIRTGCKVAVVDSTGKLIDTATIYPHEPRKDWAGALTTLAKLCKKHNVELVSVGNGTAGRETDKLVADLSDKMPDLELTRLMVSEAGASVYSASELAAKEFPDLDVSIRGAVSIARRLQDPLAELVKIEPKAIGVGQYQHDVDQGQLAKSLNGVVEDCVNAVGVDVNTASASLLSRVAGLNATIAENIVAYRDKNGPFTSRSQLKKVPRLGPKAFEQAAGFLRIMDGKNPLDASAVHPEAYPVVERIAKQTGRKVAALIGDKTFLSKLKAEDFADDTFGVPTVQDILSELEKPGRDPRPEFKTATFKDGIDTMNDLKPGMRLEGVVTNVTAFGAFVDIGVHQDGLVHISELADTFVKDPHSVVKTGQVVNVVVLEVDVSRKRIGLSMKRQGARPAAKPDMASKAPDRKPSDSPFGVLASLR